MLVEGKQEWKNYCPGVGSLLYGMRFTMLFFYVGLVTMTHPGETSSWEALQLIAHLLFGELSKIDLIVLELVDMTMVAQLVWVVALAGVSLFVTTGCLTTRT